MTKKMKNKNIYSFNSKLYEDSEIYAKDLTKKYIIKTKKMLKKLNKNYKFI